MHALQSPRDEFLHFLLIFAGLADARQAIESTLLFDFLHFMHFLLPSAGTVRPARDVACGDAGQAPKVSDEQCKERNVAREAAA
ncbi:MAG: hypothetical protein HYX38_21335 [Rhodospirillales bacterium]|nr:hypothetical protein [Rhodospirillales bacterium]